MNHHHSGRFIIGVILIIIGLAALLDIDIWRLIWPAIIIFVGVKILTGQSRRQQWSEPASETDSDKVHFSAVFNGLDERIKNDNFKGGKVSAIFGGLNLDLRDCKMTKSQTAELEIEAVFGGIKILVPDNWQVTNSANGVLGGIANHTRVSAGKEETGRLVIKGSVILAGCEISN